MPVFIWKGRTASGAVQTGELVAEDQQSVFAALRARKIIPTSVRPKPKEMKIPFLQGGKLGTRDLSIFTRQFATMINAGLPLMQCLEIQVQQTEKPGFKKVLREVMDDVEGGATLAEALRKPAPPEFKARQKMVDVLYYSFDGKVHKGQILIDERLVSDIQKAFQVALAARFPIKSVIPISDDRFYKEGEWNRDNQSMLLNNTSGFNYRKVTGGNNLSMHSYGFAIDINDSAALKNGNRTVKSIDINVHETSIRTRIIRVVAHCLLPLA
jgi:hypothetical protein